jgi:hypothetical protein
MINEWNGGIKIGRGNKYWEETWVSATLSTINIIRSSLESNTGHRDVGPTTNRLSSITALTSAMIALLWAEI